MCVFGEAGYLMVLHYCDESFFNMVKPSLIFFLSIFALQNKKTDYMFSVKRCNESVGKNCGMFELQGII
jgi:hypothetical protein